MYSLTMETRLYIVYLCYHGDIQRLPFQVDKWYVVLHGQLRLIRDSNPDKILHIGESFGVSVSLKVLPHRGRLVTATKDCQVITSCLLLTTSCLLLTTSCLLLPTSCLLLPTSCLLLTTYYLLPVYYYLLPVYY